MKISKLLPSLALVTAVIATSSCGKLEDRINSLEQRISELENTRIPSIDEQVASIKKTIGELEKTDAGLREYISALEEKQSTLETELGKTNAALTEAQKTLREEMAADKTELSGSVDAAKADVIAQLEAYKTLINVELETLNGTIESLKAKDEELQKNAEELRGYVDSENGKVRDWADATFATIEQQNKLAETVASIKTQFETLNNYTMNMDVRLTNKAEELSKSLSALDESTSQQIGALTEKLGSDISALRTELTDAYTKLIATEITKLETSMKSWVNEQLSGYYTIEQTDAKLDAMRTELEGRMDSDKTYLTTLITNLETVTNKKIAANTTLITGLRGDLTSLSQSVAENAGKIADDAILISQNTADISKNSTAIAANTKNLATVKKLAEENQKLIAENSEKLAEMQRLHNSLKDSGIEDYAETVIQNTKDIASNASLIAKNAAAIQSNATAIAQNASDIQNLSARLDATKSEIVESYTAAIAKAINDYDGTITSKLASEIARVEDKIAGLKTEVESVKSRVTALEDRVARLEEVVSRITSLSYIPRNTDYIEQVNYSRESIDIKGEMTIMLDLHPTAAADAIANDWESVLSAQAVYTQTKTSAGEFVRLKPTGVIAKDGILSVTVSSEGLDQDFVFGELSASISIKISSSKSQVMSEYIRLTPNLGEEQKLITYILKTFDTDKDALLSLPELEEVRDIDLSGYGLSDIDRILAKLPNLETLNCAKNNLTTIDLNQCMNLESVDCSSNALSTITLDKCLSIKELNCKGNKLPSIDISKNTSLQSLDCSNNVLTDLDLSNNESMRWIDFGGNGFADIEQPGLLIDGTRWSIYNVGAKSTSGYGKYYIQREAESMCPNGWRLPSANELRRLALNYSDGCSFHGTNGIFFSGNKVYSDIVPSVFLPFAGIYSKNGTYENNELHYIGEKAYYPSSEYISDSGIYILHFGISSGDYYNPNVITYSITSSNTYNKWPIRCVKDE